MQQHVVACLRWLAALALLGASVVVLLPAARRGSAPEPVATEPLPVNASDALARAAQRIGALRGRNGRAAWRPTPAGLAFLGAADDSWDLHTSCFEDAMDLGDRVLVSFIGTAHASDLYKALCRLLKQTHPALYGHNVCPAIGDHIVDGSITVAAAAAATTRPNRRTPPPPQVVATFAYQATDDASTGDGAIARPHPNATHVVYARGILDLTLYNTPPTRVAQTAAATLQRLRRAAPNATDVVVYMPHYVAPPSVNFTQPAAECVTPPRQQLYRDAMRAAATAASVATATYVRLFDAFSMTASLPDEWRRRAWLGHHYGAPVVEAIARELLVRACGSRLSSLPESLFDPSLHDAPADQFINDARYDPELRECNCSVYHPRWCELDAARRTMPVSFAGPRWRTYDAAEMPEVPSGVLEAARSNGSCSGAPVPPSRSLARWHTVRLDARTPVKPLFLQHPCSDRVLQRRARYVPQLVHYTSSEQCVSFFGRRTDYTSHALLDVDAAAARGVLSMAWFGTSYGDYAASFGIRPFLQLFPSYRVVPLLGSKVATSVRRATWGVRGPDGGLVLAYLWQAPNATFDSPHDAKGLLSAAPWRQVVAARGGQDEVLFGYGPATVYDATARALAQLRYRIGRCATRTYVYLPHHAWDRRHFADKHAPDPCTTAARQHALRDAAYCAVSADNTGAGFQPELGACDARLHRVFDPYWATEQPTALRFADRQHYMGPVLRGVLAPLLLDALRGDAAGVTEPVQAAKGGDGALLAEHDPRWEDLLVCGCLRRNCSADPAAAVTVSRLKGGGAASRGAYD